jgi:spermidine synthase
VHPAIAASAGASPARLLIGVVVCFLLSGFSALLYQTAWMRQFSLVFGTSELAVATVLAAYMAGLALGAVVAGHALPGIRRPVLVYGLLEAGIAISALAVPGLLDLAGALYVWALGGRPDPPDAASLGQPVFHLVVAFAVLAVPTSFMGATLPLLTRHAVTTDRELGPRVALLYATNTVGAVLGASIAGFALLPALGLGTTVRIGVAVNALVFLVAAWLSRAAPPLAATRTGSSVGAAGPVAGFFRSCIAPLFRGPGSASARLRAALRAQPAWILPLMLVSGATSFVYEVLWTRLLAHVIGGSIYAFSAMLATFLAGIALGGGAAGRLAASRERAAHAFALAQLGIAGLSMAVYAGMGALIPEGRELPDLVVYAVGTMLPATLFIGATFPLAVRVLARDEREAGAGTARIYAWNTLGAIAGAVLAGFWLLPALGFEGSVKLAICSNALLALVCLACVARTRLVAVGAVALGLLATLLFHHPARPRAVLDPARFLPWQLAEPREVFYAVGRSATVLVVDDGEVYWLLTNGLVEASIARVGSPPPRDTQAWLTALPIAARPDTDSMLVVGLGGGEALGGVPASVRRVDVVEIEPEVLRANRALRSQRAYDPLADERVRVIVNDGRNALRLTTRRYDAIVSQPSHPWTAGASNLFTREFVRSAKSHLNEGGVFLQWMSSDFVTLPLLRSLAATLLAEFRAVRLYSPSSSDLLFLASDSPLDVELEMARTGRPIRDEPAHFQRLGIGSVEDLVAALVAEQAGLAELAAGAPVISDDHNLMATHSRMDPSDATRTELDALFAAHDPLLDPTSWIHARLDGALSFPHLARRLIRMRKASRARALTRVLEDDGRRRLALAELQAEAGDGKGAFRAARAALEIDPGDAQARYFVFRQQLLAQGSASGDGDALAGLEGTALAVAQAWRLAGEQDWHALAGLDEALSESRVTDLWYPDAVLLRANWRSRADRDRERFAWEALRLIDSAWPFARDIRLNLARLRIAVVLGNDDVLVESARSLVGVFASQLDAAERSSVPLQGSERALMGQSLRGIVRGLDREFSAGTRDRARVVLAVARDLLRRLERSPVREPGAGARRGEGTAAPE